MKIKSIVILLTCWLLLSGLTVPAIACCEEDPPGDPSCYVCEDGVWVLKDGAECGVDSDCGDPDCWNCVDCECECDITVNSVTSNKDTACVGCDITFTANVSGSCSCVDWSGGGDPSSKSGSCTFTTKWDTHGVKTVTATPDCGDSKQKQVTVVKVDKIQYNDPDTGYTDITGTLYVCVSDTVTFKAIPDPSGASWPSGKPVWGGSSGASGTGSTTAVTFNR